MQRAGANAGAGPGADDDAGARSPLWRHLLPPTPALPSCAGSPLLFGPVAQQAPPTQQQQQASAAAAAAAHHHHHQHQHLQQQLHAQLTQQPHSAAAATMHTNNNTSRMLASNALLMSPNLVAWPPSCDASPLFSFPSPSLSGPSGAPSPALHHVGHGNSNNAQGTVGAPYGYAGSRHHSSSAAAAASFSQGLYSPFAAQSNPATLIEGLTAPASTNSASAGPSPADKVQASAFRQHQQQQQHQQHQQSVHQQALQHMGIVAHAGAGLTSSQQQQQQLLLQQQQQQQQQLHSIMMSSSAAPVPNSVNARDPLAHYMQHVYPPNSAGSNSVQMSRPTLLERVVATSAQSAFTPNLMSDGSTMDFYHETAPGSSSVFLSPNLGDPLLAVPGSIGMGSANIKMGPDMEIARIASRMQKRNAFLAARSSLEQQSAVGSSYGGNAGQYPDYPNSAVDTPVTPALQGYVGPPPLMVSPAPQPPGLISGGSGGVGGISVGGALGLGGVGLGLNSAGLGGVGPAGPMVGGGAGITGANLKVASSPALVAAAQSAEHSEHQLDGGHGASPDASRIGTIDCGRCNRSFRYKSRMLYHMHADHGSSELFPCGLCESAFRRRSELRKHMNCVHEKHRPFQCNVCPAGFYFRKDLRKHVATVHEKSRPFACTRCPQSFGKKEHLKRHLQLIHEQTLGSSPPPHVTAGAATATAGPPLQQQHHYAHVHASPFHAQLQPSYNAHGVVTNAGTPGAHLSTAPGTAAGNGGGSLGAVAAAAAAAKPRGKSTAAVAGASFA